MFMKGRYEMLMCCGMLGLIVVIVLVVGFVWVEDWIKVVMMFIVIVDMVVNVVGDVVEVVLIMWLGVEIYGY